MIAQLPMPVIRQRVAREAPRLAQLGEWPEWIAPESILERLPTASLPATGFDAGLACTLELVPRDRQSLAARLHANYTPEAIRQVKQETVTFTADSETTWWLAACAVCQEGQLSEADFSQQLQQFATLADDRQLRLQAAQTEWNEMAQRYRVIDQVAFVEADGGAQAAYCRETTPLAATYVPELDLHFLSTYHPSLGLEDFPWSDARDDEDRPRSGGVHGSTQFVKCHNREEFTRALAQAKAHFRL